MQKDKSMYGLAQLREENPDVAQVLDAFSEIDAAYNEALDALGISKKPTLAVTSSAQLQVSFERGASTSAH